MIRIENLTKLSAPMRARLRDAQLEAGRVITDCIELHRQCRVNGAPWPDRNAMHAATKGRYALHSQTVQQLAHQVLANVDATKSRRRAEPTCRTWLRYPYRSKRSFSLYWPAQAVSYDAAQRRLLLPMGRGRASLVFRLDLDFRPGAVKLVWRDGIYELHLIRPEVTAAEPPGTGRACVDLGEIHQAAVVTDGGAALVVSGRGIRSHKRLLSKQLGQIARLRTRCKKHSRRWRRLLAARRKRSRLARRRIRDLRHKGCKRVIDFCVEQKVGHLYVGDPRGVRARNSGRYHNQRMARWEMGKDIAYLDHKASKAAIACSTGDERGTSSRCPQCGHRHKPKGREWRCRKCGFSGHRDVVGGTNMFRPGFNTQVTFPALITYRRPGPSRAGRGPNSRARMTPVRRSRPDTGHRGGVPPPVLLEVA